MSTAKPAANVSDTILTVAVEGLAVGLLTLIAASSKEAGSLAITFMIGLWLIWIVSNSGIISRTAGTIGNIGALAQ